MKQYNRVYARINLDTISYNLEQMYVNVGKQAQMVAVIKADGYGHGALQIAELLEDTEYVWGYAVACLSEGLMLRKAGIKKPILVLGCVFPDEYEDMILHQIRAALYTKEMAEMLEKTAEKLSMKAYVHVKIDTGMGRIGFSADRESIDIISDICRLPHLVTEGIFTHFARADEEDKGYTFMQHDRFMNLVEELKKRQAEIPLVHCDNSAGIIDFPQFAHQLVRAGISLYGLYPSEEVSKEKIILKPALELKSHVTYVKKVEAGTPVSYGGTFVTDRPMTIATIPVGYGDGYPRALSGKGNVLIRGKRAPVLGRICMDQLMVDVTDIPDTTFMDEVTLVGKDGAEEISVEELSELSGRFPYEFICCLGKRIPRIYMKNEEITV